jgi:hypothetical protein
VQVSNLQLPNTLKLMIDPSGVLKQDLKGYGLDVPRIFILNPKRTTASSISNQRREKQFSDERQPDSLGRSCLVEVFVASQILVTHFGRIF